MPDVPISSFEVNLPQNPHSALTEKRPAKSEGSFCSSKLVMPTMLTAQNGLQIKTEHEDRGYRLSLGSKPRRPRPTAAGE